MSQTGKKKRIRSYVIRSGRQTRAQSLALQRYWPEYGIEFTGAEIDLDRVFNRRAGRVLDIGPGMGETTTALAGINPQHDFLAVEVHPPGVGSLLSQINKWQLPNVKIIRHDIVEVLQKMIPGESFSVVTIFFPDPWPKKRHHKRRLVNSRFLQLLLPALTSNARLYIATDTIDLAEYMRQECDACPGLVNLAGKGNFSPRPVWRPMTKFELRGVRLGHTIRDLVYCKR